MTGVLNLCVWHVGSQQSHEARLNTRTRLGIMPLETQHQHRRGVGSTNQPKTIRPVNPQAIDGAQLTRRPKVFGICLCGHHQRVNQRMSVLAAAVDIQLWRTDAIWQPIEYRADVGRAAQNF